MLHASAYALIFDSMGRALAASLAEWQALDQDDAGQRLGDSARERHEVQCQKVSRNFTLWDFDGTQGATRAAPATPSVLWLWVSEIFTLSGAPINVRRHNPLIVLILLTGMNYA
jgi:hypothetical protein